MKFRSVALENQIITPRKHQLPVKKFDHADLLFALLVGSCLGLGLANCMVGVYCKSMGL